MENAFSYTGPFVWNSLPLNIRTIKNPANFKTALKTHYFKEAFSDIIKKNKYIIILIFKLISNLIISVLCIESSSGVSCVHMLLLHAFI